MLKKISLTALTTIAAAALTACGGGGGSTVYQVNFSGNVTGLPTGQQVTLLGSIPATSQTIPINITQNGSFSNNITLPSGYNLSSGGNGIVTVSQQPTGASCSLSYLTTSAITITCNPVTGAAGLYTGPLTTSTTSNGYGKVFIQNNGNYWFLAGTKNTATNTITYSAIIKGTGTSTTSSFTSSNGVDVFSTPQIVNAGITATYQSLANLTGTLIDGTTTASFNFAEESNYSFNTSPSLATITGTYNFSFVGKTPTMTASVVIPSSNGIFNATTNTGCSITGSFTPLTTGENAYAMTLSYGSAPCPTPSTTQTGSVILETTTIGNELIGGTFSSNAANGTLLVGVKQ